jgi:hypothetical protein
MHLTPEILVANYGLLRVCDPFRRWRLPDADDIVFRVTRSHHDRAAFHAEAGDLQIDISDRLHGTLPELLVSMAHEMVHLRQHLMGFDPTHGEEFRRLARQVCKHHGFDLKAF